MGIADLFLVLVLAVSSTPVVFSQSSADELYRRGLDSYNGGRFEEAIEAFERAAALQPNVPDYRLSLGLAYLKTGRAREAARELEAVRGMIGMQRRTRDKEPEILVHLGTAYFQLDNLDAARKRLETALRLDPDLVEADYTLGLIDEREGNAEKAIGHFDAVLRREPTHPGANLAVARRLQRQGKRAEALERLRDAARGDPANFDVIMAFGSTAFELGETEEARQAFQYAVELNPSNPDASFNLGAVLLAAGAYGDAAKVLEPLAEGETPHNGACFNLAQAYRGAGRIEDALRVLQGLLSRTETYPGSFLLLGLLRESTGDVAGAKEAYRKEIELRPTHIPPYLNLAVLLARDKDREKALALLEKAIGLCSDEDEAARIQAAVEALKNPREP